MKKIAILNERDLGVAEKVKDMVSQKVKVHEVRIFGSRARGTAMEESDLDILIIVDFLNHAIEKYISDCAWEVGFANDVIVVPIAISQDTLRNGAVRESVFLKNVYSEGILV